MSHYRAIGSLLQMPEHYVEVADICHPTITGSIRCGEIDREAKRRFAYLEIQRIVGDEYEIVDSWSNLAAELE